MRHRWHRRGVTRDIVAWRDSLFPPHYLSGGMEGALPIKRGSYTHYAASSVKLDTATVHDSDIASCRRGDVYHHYYASMVTYFSAANTCRYHTPL